MSPATEKDFIEAILAAPRDPAARQIYADWLLERGDRRGEHLAAKLVVEECTANRDFQTERYRKAQIAIHGFVKGWIALPWNDDFSFSLDGKPLLPLPRLPFTSVSFHVYGADAPATIGQIRAVGALTSTVERVRVFQGGTHYEFDPGLVAVDAPDDRLVTTAAFDPFLRELHAFELSSADFPDRPFPSTLRALSIHARSELWSERIVPALAGCPHLEHFGNYEWPARAWTSLLAAWPFSRVKRLAFYVRDGEPAPTRAFREVGAARYAERFETNVDFDEDLVAALDGVPLDELYSSGRFDPVVVRAPMRVLSVADAGPAEVNGILDRLPDTLHWLSLANATIDDATAERMAEDHRLTRLLRLALYQAKMSPKARERLKASSVSQRIHRFEGLET